MILALSSSIDLTFRNALYSSSREQSEKDNGMRPGALHTTSNIYYTSDNTQDRYDAIRRNYEQYYEIVAPDAFAKNISNMIKVVNENVKNNAKAAIRERLSREFSNRIIIVDEVHNIKSKMTESNVSSSLKPYNALREILRNSENVRLILMSATPMFNEPTEIINIFNLLLANDDKPELKSSDIFEEVENENRITKSGLAILRSQAQSYISYFRGYNPVSFPSLLEVDDKINKIYRLNKLYFPQPKIDWTTVRKQTLRQLIRHTKLIRCPMSDFQFENYLIHVQSTSRRTNVAYKEEKDLCGIIFPSPFSTGEVGKAGFDGAFRLIHRNKFNNMSAYRYLPHCKGFLKRQNLNKYSCKYWQILENIKLSPGIAFVYLEYIEIGVEVMAMILDCYGYENVLGGHYLQDHETEYIDKICSVCNQPRRDRAHPTQHPFRQAKYAIMQGQDSMNTNNDMLLRINRVENKYGHEIKVVLGSPVTRESVDFANIRQIHIASVWYNMSRIVQVIGRGVRTCSHKNLPESDRNITVFRYCVSAPLLRRKTIISKEMYQIETGDELMWRRSEQKDITIKKIERELKRIAIDCQANKAANLLATDIDFSRDCDYLKCEYDCIQQHPFKKIDYDRSTSDLIVHQNDLENAKFLISKLFRDETRLSYTFEEICDIIQNGEVSAGV